MIPSVPGRVVLDITSKLKSFLVGFKVIYNFIMKMINGKWSLVAVLSQHGPLNAGHVGPMFYIALFICCILANVMCPAVNSTVSAAVDTSFSVN